MKIRQHVPKQPWRNIIKVHLWHRKYNSTKTNKQKPNQTNNSKTPLSQRILVSLSSSLKKFSSKSKHLVIISVKFNTPYSKPRSTHYLSFIEYFIWSLLASFHLLVHKPCLTSQLCCHSTGKILKDWRLKCGILSTFPLQVFKILPIVNGLHLMW